MENRQLGKTGLQISALTLGTWVMGGGEWWGKDHDDQRYIDTISSAIDHGINLIDTAIRYGFGHSEEVVGKAISGKRDKLIVSTKAYSELLLAENAQETVEASLKRLDIDYIDIYYIHWPKPGISIARSMEALEKLRDKELIRFIGVSNVTIKHLEIAQTAGTVDVMQPPYSLFWNKSENDLLPYAEQHGIGTMTYSALGMGLLTGKFSRDSKFDEGDMRSYRVSLFQPDIFPVALEAVERLKSIAAKYGATLAQTAINWAATQPGVDTAIVGARTPAQLADNLGALDFEISAADRHAMREICEPVVEAVADWDTMYAQRSEAIRDITE